MEKTKFLYGALGLLALGMTACSSDAPVGNGVAEQDENRYLRVNLVNPAGTRAAEFEAGTAAENAVNSVVMDFYDAAGNFVVRANPNDISWISNNMSEGAEGSVGPNVGVIGEAVVKIGINKEQNLPAYVMCYLNPVSWGSDGDKRDNLTDLRQVPRANYKTTVDGTDYFAMNNSCYYGLDKVTGQANVKISGTAIAETELYKTEAEAHEEEAAMVDIYVERYAAKVNFTAETTPRTGTFTAPADGAAVPADQKGIYAYTGSTPVATAENGSVAYSLAFNAERWTINADAPTMYAVKNFSTVSPEAPVPTLAQVNEYLGSWNLWNDEGNHRSYWSCSPAYFASEFPQVSDQIADQVAGGTGAGQAVGNFALKYYSYNQICVTNGGNGNNQFSALTDGTLPVKYALENTMGKPAFASLNPKAAVPSVLLVGNYRVTYGGTELPAGTSFYLFNNSIYFKTAPTGIDNVVLMRDKFIADQQILYVKNTAADGTVSYSLLTKANPGVNTNLDLLAVKHPDLAVRDQNLVPQRFVTLQLTGVPTDLYYRPNGSGDFVQVATTNLNFVNTLLWQQSSVAYAYEQGKCYFSMPIWHLGMTENTVNSPLINGVLDWDKLRVGDMGLVRNHVYKLNVDVITGLATGIENLDYPIVPPMDQDEYWIKYRINILNWRIVPPQNGIILK